MNVHVVVAIVISCAAFGVALAALGLAIMAVQR